MDRSLRVCIDERVYALAVVLAALVMVSIASSAGAACGDDVDGVRVACRCGDVVVSDTRLLPDDPVVTERCMSDGLFVRARSGGESLRLDLNGLSIIGLGVGSGIRVLDGGAAGAIITGGPNERPGAVSGFATGLRASGQRSVKIVRNLLLHGNRHDGLALRGAGTILESVTAKANGRDGMRLGGRDVDMRGVDAHDNNGYGVRTSGANVRGRVVTNGNGKGGLQGSRRSSETNQLGTTTGVQQ